MTHESEPDIGPDDAEADEHASSHPTDALIAASAHWWQVLTAVATSLRALASAQGALAKAEWRLSRSLVTPLLLLALIAVVLAVALGLTLLALAAMVLATWWQSWVLALLTLTVMLAGLLGLSLYLLQRCARRMSLPQTRAQWQQTAHEFKTAAWASETSATTDTESHDDAMAS